MLEGMESPCPSKVESKSQSIVANIRIYEGILVNVPAVVYCMFAGTSTAPTPGPWSDTNGRKLLILFPIIGQALGITVLIIALIFHNLPAEFLLLW